MPQRKLLGHCSDLNYLRQSYRVSGSGPRRVQKLPTLSQMFSDRRYDSDNYFSRSDTQLKNWKSEGRNRKLGGDPESGPDRNQSQLTDEARRNELRKRWSESPIPRDQSSSGTTGRRRRRRRTPSRDSNRSPRDRGTGSNRVLIGERRVPDRTPKKRRSRSGERRRSPKPQPKTESSYLDALEEFRTLKERVRKSSARPKSDERSDREKAGKRRRIRDRSSEAEDKKSVAELPPKTEKVELIALEISLTSKTTCSVVQLDPYFLPPLPSSSFFFFFSIPYLALTLALRWRG